MAKKQKKGNYSDRLYMVISDDDLMQTSKELSHTLSTAVANACDMVSDENQTTGKVYVYRLVNVVSPPPPPVNPIVETII